MSFKELLGSLVNGGVRETIKDVKHSVKETMDDIEKRTRIIVANVVKSSIVLIIVILGLVFALVGLSRYLTETVASLNHGLGYVVVGGALILLGLFAKLMQKD